MALADFEPSRKQIMYKGEPLAKVRGLSLVDLAVLVRYHGADMRSVYDQVITPGMDPLQAVLSEAMLIRITTLAPDLAARTISLAADEPDGMRGIRLMPMPLQVMLLKEISTLTFEDVGGPKAFAGMVGIAMAGVMPIPDGARMLPGEIPAAVRKMIPETIQ